MGDYKSSQPKSYPLEIIKRLRETPQLLPHESLEEFHELFASFEDYGKPQNLRDYLAVHQHTVLTWDTSCRDPRTSTPSIRPSNASPRSNATHSAPIQS